MLMTGSGKHSLYDHNLINWPFLCYRINGKLVNNILKYLNFTDGSMILGAINDLEIIRKLYQYAFSIIVSLLAGVGSHG